jgi:hypothetical protein
MCSKAKAGSKNVMTNKANWKAQVINITHASTATALPGQPEKMMFHNVSKLAAFTVFSDHPALKVLNIKKPPRKVILLKCGYSSALIMSVSGQPADYLFSKKVMFNETHEVTVLAVSIETTDVAYPDVAAEIVAEMASATQEVVTPTPDAPAAAV